MDKTKLILFLMSIGLPVSGTDFERTINESKFDLTDIVLKMAAQRLGKEEVEISNLYQRYKPV